MSHRSFRNITQNSSGGLEDTGEPIYRKNKLGLEIEPGLMYSYQQELRSSTQITPKGLPANSIFSKQQVSESRAYKLFQPAIAQQISSKVDFLQLPQKLFKTSAEGSIQIQGFETRQSGPSGMFQTSLDSKPGQKYFQTAQVHQTPHNPDLQSAVNLLKIQNDQVRQLESKLEQDYQETEQQTVILSQKQSLLEEKLGQIKKREMIVRGILQTLNTKLEAVSSEKQQILIGLKEGEQADARFLKSLGFSTETLLEMQIQAAKTKPKNLAVQSQRLEVTTRQKAKLGSKAKNTSQILVSEPADQEKTKKNLPHSLRSTPKGQSSKMRIPKDIYLGLPKSPLSSKLQSTTSNLELMEIQKQISIQSLRNSSKNLSVGRVLHQNSSYISDVDNLRSKPIVPNPSSIQQQVNQSLASFSQKKKQYLERLEVKNSAQKEIDSLTSERRALLMDRIIATSEEVVQLEKERQQFMDTDLRLSVLFQGWGGETFLEPDDAGVHVQNLSTQEALKSLEETYLKEQGECFEIIERIRTLQSKINVQTPTNSA